MTKEGISFVDGPPHIVVEGELIHLIDRSGDLVTRRVMTRHTFKQFVDEAIGVLTQPRPAANITRITQPKRRPRA